MDNYKIEMGKRLRKERKRNNLTQEKIAEMLDISVKHYSEVERGITGLSVENIIKVSNILSISIDYLLKGEVDEFDSQIINFFGNLPEYKRIKLYNIVKLIDEYKEAGE